MNEEGYLELLKNVLHNGNSKMDRTGTGTLSLFAPNSLLFDLRDNTLPMLTTKRISYKVVLHELLWFLKGETNSKILESNGVNIWKGNSSDKFLKSRGLNYPEGELGPLYGFQWRNFGGDFDNDKTKKT